MKDITFDDLNEDDVNVLKTGVQQYLPQRDHANRTITIFPTTIATTLTMEMYLSPARYRAMWYMIMSYLPYDEFGQIKGSIVVILNMNNNTKNSMKSINLFGRAFYASQSKWYTDALPYKISAMHCFYDAKSVGYKFMSLFYFLYRSRMDENVTRFLTHYTPTLQDVVSTLQSYGIPTTDLPFEISDDDAVVDVDQNKRDGSSCSITTHSSTAITSGANGTIRLVLDNHNQWMERQRIHDMAAKIRKQQLQDHVQRINKQQQKKLDGGGCTAEQQETTNWYVVGPPNKLDVLLGKGSKCANHPGNLRAFTVAEMNRREYDQCSKFEKTIFAERLVLQIQRSGGRFLKKAVVVNPGKKTKFESYSWIEATNLEAREKISHIFRRLRELDNINNSSKGKSTTTTDIASKKRKNPEMM